MVGENHRPLSGSVVQVSLAQHPALSTPPICGNTALDAESERRIRCQRAELGARLDGGCGRQMNWLSAYRCLECGRWMHAECLRQHFVEHGDVAAEAQQRADSAEQAWRDLNKRAGAWIAESERKQPVVDAAKGLIANPTRDGLKALAIAVSAYRLSEGG